MKTLFQIFLTVITLLVSEKVIAQPYWNSISSEDIQEIYCLTNYHQCIYAGTSNGWIFHSSDNGRTWGKWYMGKPEYSRIFSIATSSTGKVFAGTEDGLYRSVDSGVHWTRIAPGWYTPIYSWPGYQLSISTYPPHTIAVCTDVGIIHYSNDDGDTWVTMPSPAVTDGYVSILFEPNFLLVSNIYTGLYSSADNGNNWAQLSTGPPYILINDSLQNIYASFSNLILRSSNQAKSWDTVFKKSGVTIQNLACDELGRVIILSADGDIFTSSNAGNSWIHSHITKTNVGTYKFCATDSIALSTSTGIYLVDPYTGLGKSAMVSLTQQTITAAASCTTGYIAFTNTGNFFVRKRSALNWIDISDTTITSISSALPLDTTILLATNRGVLNFHPSTLSYQPTDTTLGPYPIRFLKLAEDNIIYAAGTGTHGDLFKTTDSGRTWIKCSVGLPGGGGITDIVATHQHGLVVSSDYRLYGSTDGAATWQTLLSAGPIKKSLTLGINDTILSGFYGNGLLKLVPPYSDGKTVALQSMKITGLFRSIKGIVYALSDSSSGQFQSSDFGTSWIPVSPSFRGNSIHSIVENSNGEMVACSDGGGVFISSDTLIGWQSSNEPIAASNIGSVASNRFDVYAAGNKGLFVSHDSGTTWNILRKNDSGFVFTSLSVNNDGLILAGMNTNRVLRSVDFGQTWSVINPYSNTGAGIWSFFRSNQSFFICTQGGVFSSIDKGVTWDSIMSGNWVGGASQKDTSIYVISLDGHILHSSDQLQTLRQNEQGLIRDYYVSLTIDSLNKIFLGNATGLFVQDFFENSSPFWRQLTSWNISASYTAPSGMKIFGGHYGDVMHSADPDSLWPLVNVNGPTTTIQSITTLGDWVFVAPLNAGVCRSKLPGIQKVNSSVPTATDSKILLPTVKLFPNPASDECKLQIDLTHLEPVWCELYSIDGRKILTWIIDPEGSYSLQSSFSIRDLVKGTYFIHFSNSSWSSTLKFIKL